MKERGFTLVELLAVIAIVAILMVSAGAAVISTLNKSKINTFKNEALTAISSAQKLYAVLSADRRLSEEYLVEDSTGAYRALCVSLPGLTKNGYLEKDIRTYGGVVLVEVSKSGDKTKYMIWMHNSRYGINGVEKNKINGLKFDNQNNDGAEQISGGKLGIVTKLDGINKVINFAQTSTTSENPAMNVGGTVTGDPSTGHALVNISSLNNRGGTGSVYETSIPCINDIF